MGETATIAGGGPVDDATATVNDRGGGGGPRNLIGRTLGAFTIAERIGGGGGGDVFRAEQPELRRSVVVKVMRRASGPSADRFLREARLASRLDHPYAAHIYAFGVEPDHLLWLAMEHVRGRTLSELVDRRGAIPLAVFAPFFERLCEVVQSAHELGIVHRDIKPSNVMVIERAGQMLPKLLDFGVAKAFGDEPTPDGDDDEADNDLTAQGVIVGTPPYMAPEQWSEGDTIDARTDIYGLGGLAFACLTGKPPFRASTREGLMLAHLNDAPPPLGVGPAELDVAVHRALAKAQGQRWPSATAFAAAVRQAIGTPSVESIPLLDPAVREAWIASGPQPIAEAVAALSDATTTRVADQALADVVDVACRWLAAIALASAQLDGIHDDVLGPVRERATAVGAKGTAAGWLAIATAVGAPSLPALAPMFANLAPLAALAERVAEPRRSRDAGQLQGEVTQLGEALAALQPLLGFRLVVGGERGPELWTGRRTGLRDRVVTWGDPIGVGEVVLLDDAGRVALRLDPLVRARRPMPTADVELFLITRAGRGVARLAATPWGYELDDADAGRYLDRVYGHDTSSGHVGDEVSPYPGLASYGRNDRDRFFGREPEIEAVANRMVRATMIAVLGPSGVGKSSFLYAGLAARMSDAVVVAMRPGREPLAALAAAIARDASIPKPAATVEALESAMVAIAGRAPRGAVLIVDQLEEIDTLADRPQRVAFEQLLAKLGRDQLRVVVGLRDDFAGILASSDALRDRVEPFVLGAPSSPSLERALVEPARRAGHAFETSVVRDIVAELAGRPAALSLLGFTASRLWHLRDRERRLLTAEAYKNVGGVGGALAAYADEVYGSLDRRGQDIARAVFDRLVAPDGTRVPVSRRDLDSLGDGAASVIERLVEARLLSVRESDTPDGEVVEPVHESLAERWPRLVRWRTEAAVDRALLADLHAAVRRWEASGRTVDQLWRGAAVRDLRRLLAGGSLVAREREFAEASVAHARRGEQRRRTLIAAAGIAITITAGVLGYLKVQADHAADDALASATRADHAAAAARASADVADKRLTESLVIDAKRELGQGHSFAALVYLGEALRRGVDTPAIRLLLGLAEAPWRYQHVRWHDVVRISVSDDGTWYAASDTHGELRWWNGDGSGEQHHKFDTALDGFMLSHDNTRLAVLLHDSVTLIDRKTGASHAFAVPKEVIGVYFGAGERLVLPTAKGVILVDSSGKVERSVDLPEDMRKGDATSRVWICAGKGVLSKTDLDTGKTDVLGQFMPRKVTQSLDHSAISFVDRDLVVHVVRFDGYMHAFPLPVPSDEGALSHDGSIVAIHAGDAIYEYAITGELRRTIELRATAIRRFAIDGDDLWVGGSDGTLRHWRGEYLVAGFVGHPSSIDSLHITKAALITSATNGAFAAWDADTSPLLHVGAEVCPGPYRRRVSGAEHLLSIVYCDVESGFIVGPGHLVVPVARPFEVDAAAASNGRVAIARSDYLELLSADGTVKRGPKADSVGLAFADPDHVLVANDKKISRWSLSDDHFDTLLTSDDRTFGDVTGAGSLVFAGDSKGRVYRIAGNQVTGTTELGIGVSYLSPSDDGTSVAVLLNDGTAVVLDAQHLDQHVPLPRGGDNDAPPVFDPSGKVVVRVGDLGMTIFDRANGDEIGTLRDFGAGSIDDPAPGAAPDTLHVMFGSAPAVFDLPRDTRPVDVILADIRCRVPFRLDGLALRETTPNCENP